MKRPGAPKRIARIVRALCTVSLYLYVTFTVLMTILHYPYSTDATAASTQSATQSARSFYESAYRPASGTQRGIDYEKTAALAAKQYNIEGEIRQFVQRHGLEEKRVLEIGSGRGYLQDVVTDYTGLDLSPSVAANYHKPFVVGSATDLPFQESVFDAAWTIWVMEHIATPQKAFDEMRRVIKPGGVLFLGVAWNCPPWLADGFGVRPYADFTLAGKLVKASIPFRSSVLFTYGYLLPIRVTRLIHYRLAGSETALHYRRLEPNYEIYWQPDSDAAISLDMFESMLWFQSRGDSCLNCEGTAAELAGAVKPLAIRVNKP
jgi:SAM-dependent methyltransferase